MNLLRVCSLLLKTNSTALIAVLGPSALVQLLIAHGALLVLIKIKEALGAANLVHSYRTATLQVRVLMIASAQKGHMAILVNVKNAQTKTLGLIAVKMGC